MPKKKVKGNKSIVGPKKGMGNKKANKKKVKKKY